MKYNVGTGFSAILLIASLAAGAADNGAALYKKRCARCHGTNGDGKAATNAPGLKGTPLETNYVAGHITKGESSSKGKPPHKQGMTGLSEGQAIAIAKYVKTLK
jgi:cytochrome c6